MKKLEQHPLSAAFPPMSHTEFESLCENIREHGQRPGMEVVIFEGKVLDGWHRHNACYEVGLVPRTILFAGKDPVEFVKAMNLHRRHLSASQRAAAVVACNEWHDRGESKSEPGADLPKKVTTAEMAKEAEVSTRTIEHAKAAQRAGMGEAVRDGEISAKEAAEVAKPKPEIPPTRPGLAARHTDIPVEAEEGKTITVPLSEWEELNHNLETALSENDEMGKIIDADDKLKVAHDEAAKWKRKHDALEIRFRGQTNELNECKKAVKRLQGAVKKLETQVPKREREPGEEG